VSHDRYFINRVANKIWVMDTGGGITEYLGNYDAYLLKRAQLDEPEIEVVQESVNKTRLQKERKKEREISEQMRLARARFDELEEQIAQIETLQVEIEKQLADGMLTAQQTVEASTQYHENAQMLARLMADWEQMGSTEG